LNLFLFLSIMVSLFAAQIDLFLQGGVLVLLTVSIAAMRLKKIKPHAWLMLTAVTVNFIAFSAIMAPAFTAIALGIGGTISFTALVHVAIGALTMLTSLWVLGTWLAPSRFEQNPKLRCYGKFNKHLMTAVTLLWIAAIIAGIVLFLMVYTTVLGPFTIGGG
jgi:hypothetical protein